MAEALDGFEIAGVTTNLAFLKALVGHPQVVRGDIDTGFIEREISGARRRRPAARPLDLAAACVAVLVREQNEQVRVGAAIALGPHRWLDHRRNDAAAA